MRQALDQETPSRRVHLASRRRVNVAPVFWSTERSTAFAGLAVHTSGSQFLHLLHLQGPPDARYLNITPKWASVTRCIASTSLRILALKSGRGWGVKY